MENVPGRTLRAPGRGKNKPAYARLLVISAHKASSSSQDRYVVSYTSSRPYYLVFRGLAGRATATSIFLHDRHASRQLSQEIRSHMISIGFQLFLGFPAFFFSGS